MVGKGFERGSNGGGREASDRMVVGGRGARRVVMMSGKDKGRVGVASNGGGLVATGSE